MNRIMPNTNTQQKDFYGGYPLNAYLEYPPKNKEIFILDLRRAEERAKAVLSFVQDVYFNYLGLMEGTPDKELTDRLEHSARIVEMAAFQLQEMTGAALKKYTEGKNE